MTAERTGVLVVGVGGQGALTAARVLGEAAVRSGQEVVLGQLHGMSQKGGSVEATVLFGPGHGSFIGAGQADVVLGMEPLEVLRALPRLSAETAGVVNLGRVVPTQLAIQGRAYPEVGGVLARVRARAPRRVAVDGPALARAAGAPQALNMALLGALCGLGVLPVSPRAVWAAAAARLRHLENNRRAFELGLAWSPT